MSVISMANFTVTLCHCYCFFLETKKVAPRFKALHDVIYIEPPMSQKEKKELLLAAKAANNIKVFIVLWGKRPTI